MESDGGSVEITSPAVIQSVQLLFRRVLDPSTVELEGLRDFYNEIAEENENQRAGADWVRNMFGIFTSLESFLLREQVMKHTSDQLSRRRVLSWLAGTAAGLSFAPHQSALKLSLLKTENYLNS